ncbi:MAG: hypothetical protein LBK60_04205 [Verrucomicrobiales bacterium]|nr:hypothetical protein [Verrucomicrobiales bacterium]
MFRKEPPLPVRERLAEQGFTVVVFPAAPSAWPEIFTAHSEIFGNLAI